MMKPNTSVELTISIQSYLFEFMEKNLNQENISLEEVASRIINRVLYKEQRHFIFNKESNYLVKSV